MKILGIETSCDETATALVKVLPSGKIAVLSNVISSQIKIHALTGGVVPEVAARAHLEKIIPVIKTALKQAGVRLEKIDAVAVTAGPGLITSLMVGVDTAKTLSAALNKPLVAVNHIEAHAYSAFGRNSEFEIRNSKTIFPALALVVSGGHTDLILIKDWLSHKKIGQTLDDAAGECFDKVAKILNLGYPGGPIIARLAENGNPQTVNFPRPMINSGDFNFSFSGLKTAVLYYVRSVGTSRDLSQQMKSDIAASTQAAIVDVLAAKTISAAKKYKVKTILVGGGVAANDALRHQLKVQSKKLKVKLLITPFEYCTDNAAMIAFAGWLHARKKDFMPALKVRADSGWEIKE